MMKFRETAVSTASDVIDTSQHFVMRRERTFRRKVLRLLTADTAAYKKALLCLVAVITVMTGIAVDVGATTGVDSDGYVTISKEQLLPIYTGTAPGYSSMSWTDNTRTYASCFGQQRNLVGYTTASAAPLFANVKGTWSNVKRGTYVQRQEVTGGNINRPIITTTIIEDEPAVPTSFAFTGGLPFFTDINGRTGLSIGVTGNYGYIDGSGKVVQVTYPTSTSYVYPVPYGTGHQFFLNGGNSGHIYDSTSIEDALRVTGNNVNILAGRKYTRATCYGLRATGVTHKIKLSNCVTGSGTTTDVHFALATVWSDTNTFVGMYPVGGVGQVSVNGHYVGTDVVGQRETGFTYVDRNTSILESTIQRKDPVTGQITYDYSLGNYTIYRNTSEIIYNKFTPWKVGTTTASGNVPLTLSFGSNEVIIDGGTYKGSPAISGTLIIVGKLKGSKFELFNLLTRKFIKVFIWQDYPYKSLHQ